MNRKPKIGLLGLMIELYRVMPEIQKRMEVWVAEMIESFEAWCDVVYSGVCDTRPVAEAAVRTMEAEEVDLLVVFPLTYAPSHLSIPLLKKTRLPFLILNTQLLNGWPATVSADCFLDNQAPTGVFDLTNTLVRNEIPFDIVSGWYKDERFLAELKAWCIAARAVKEIRQSTVGLIGYTMDGMGDLAADYTALISWLGVEVKHLSLSELIELCSQAPMDALKKQMEFDRTEFLVDASLSEHEHRNASRLEWAVRTLIRKYGLDAFTFHFGALAEDGRFSAMPLLAASKLLSEGIGYGGEGDIMSALAVAFLNRIAEEVDFFESWGMDFVEGALLRNHMGEGNYRLARKDTPVRLVRAPMSIGGSVASNAVPVFTLKPGDATLVNLTTTKQGKIKLIASEGCVPDFQPIAGVNSPHGKFKPDTPVIEYLNAYAYAGGSHHGALAYGRIAGTVAKAARLLGIEFERI